jgi:hypothetical protein
MTDGPDNRRIGQAQRRRNGGASNVYADTVKPPTHGVGDTVKAKGRYRTGTVTAIFPSIGHPGEGSDGHGYEVTGGKGGRKSTHLSGELKPFQEGQTEAI